MKVRCLLYFIAAVAWSYPLTAEIKLPEIFSDGMVFQRDMPVKIWGTADANSQVDVEFAGKKSSTKAGADGKWTLNLPPMEASDSPRKMNILENGKPAKTVSDRNNATDTTNSKLSFFIALTFKTLKVPIRVFSLAFRQ